MKKIRRCILATMVSLTFLGCSVDNDIPSSANPTGQDPEPEAIEIPVSNTLGTLLYEPAAYDGYTLFTIHKHTYLIDNCGRVVNQWSSTYDRGGAFCLLQDGSLLRSGKIDNPDLPYGGIGGIIEKFDWDGNLTWSFRHTAPTYSQHHGLVPLPNGNVLLLAAHKKTKNEALSAGRNPEQLSDGELYDERILEIRPLGKDAGTIVWEWRAWDHLIQDFDDTKSNFGIVSENPQLLDINFLGNSNGDADWLHFNSLRYNQDLDQILLSSQKLSEIYIIDHSTTSKEAESGSGGNGNKGGNFLFRWGNPEAYQHGTSADKMLFGPHNAHWIPKGSPDTGKILIFNNGLGRLTDYSSVDMISTPIEQTHNYSYSLGASYRPSTAEWSYTNPDDPSLFYSKILSSAQQLPNGNILICEGTKGTFFEIDKNQDVVWKYVSPVTSKGVVLRQGETPSANIFQVIRYSKDYSGFVGKNLSPKDPLELSFDIGNCK